MMLTFLRSEFQFMNIKPPFKLMELALVVSLLLVMQVLN